jgi:hypothetical protein|tara:strand:- start:116 stop:529 length:414 start_codon:yes stop_codon:yes gene_type:complete
MFLALLLAAFLFPTFGSGSIADAQPNSRVCGISLNTMAMLIEIKQPVSKKGRNKADEVCEEIAGGMEKGLKEAGQDTTTAKWYIRKRCERVAKDISHGEAPRRDICDLMDRSRVIASKVKIYTINYIGDKKFEATRN